MNDWRFSIADCRLPKSEARSVNLFCRSAVRPKITVESRGAEEQVRVTLPNAES